MSLTTLWQTSREQLANKQVHQIIAFAGDGKLRDGNAACVEFRELLSQIPSGVLCKYAEDCLNNSFTDSGLALQDIINQVGRRLGFNVEDGKYRGSRSSIGYDGLWRFPSGHSVVIEVKTTDTYRIDSNKIADYRKRLIGINQIEKDKSSILIVVGRKDTGDLEAQIRGSRHAWDIRLISIDALLRIMLLKESVDDPQIIGRICSTLIPQEFTRLDRIIDIVFSTTEEAKQEEQIDETESLASELDPQARIKKSIQPVAFHEACIERLSKQQEIVLVRQSRNRYTTPDNKIAVVCAVSKAHEKQNHTSYWFAFHPYQKDFLEEADKGFLVLGCGSQEKVLVVPIVIIRKWLDDFWTTELEDRMYWHVRIHLEGSKLYLDRKQGKGRLEITQYLI